MICLYSTIYRAQCLRGNSTMVVTSQQARHYFAAFIHFVAFWFLIGFALNEDSDLSVYNSQFWWVHEKRGITPRKWYFQCVNTTTNTFIPNDYSCGDDDKRFYVKRNPSETITFINVIVLACLYVGWSALGHLLAGYMPSYQRIIRWFDYSVTAPTMLVVLSVSFGADSATAIVLAPTVLAILLIFAGILERRCECKGVKEMSYYRVSTIAMLFIVFIPVMIPVLYASHAITKDGDPGTGTAPKFVFAFALVVVILFSSFALVYAWDMLRPMEEDVRERWYLYLSMIAKTTLHLFLGLTVIGQSNNVGVDDPNIEEDDMDTLAIGLGGSAALVFGLGIINYKFDYLFGYATYERLTNQTNLKINLIWNKDMNITQTVNDVGALQQGPCLEHCYDETATPTSNITLTAVP